MKANRSQVEKALQSPASTRCFLFHGPDDSGSHALARRLRQSAGKDAEIIALTGGDLKGDPARLSDEAAAFSMFGGARIVIVEPCGDESHDAVAAWLDSDVKGAPVGLVAGALKATSKLLKLVTGAGNGLAFASYPPDARDLDRLVIEMARPLGLTMPPDVAQRIGEISSANRAIIEQELAKFALYLGASSARPAELGHDAIDAIGAAREEGDSSALIDHVFDGRPADAETELARLRSEGSEGITLIRAAFRRAVLLAKLRARVEQGQSPGQVIASQGKALFQRDKPGVERQLPRWRAESLSRCIERLILAERDVKASGGLGPVAADVELLAIARQAARRG